MIKYLGEVQFDTRNVQLVASLEQKRLSKKRENQVKNDNCTAPHKIFLFRAQTTHPGAKRCSLQIHTFVSLKSDFALSSVFPVILFFNELDF